MRKIFINENWTLRYEPLSLGSDSYRDIERKNDGWIEVKCLPTDVHTSLIENGIIEEPLVGLNSFDCEWIEDRSFWLRKSFFLKEEDLSRHGVELFIEYLDIHADIFLNGIYVAHHSSAMYPFSKNVLSYLREGENVLLIRLTTGLERVADGDIAEVRGTVSCEWRRRREGRGEERRCMLRKPQYVFGWDQSPRLATCAVGRAEIRVLDELVIRNIAFETTKITEDTAEIFAEVEIESRRLTTACTVEAEISLKYEGVTVYSKTEKYLSQPGINVRDLSFTLDNPRLWWPNGYGEQPLYTVSVKVKNNNGAYDEKEIVTGIRTVRLDTSAVSEEENNYRFIVNGRAIYARGANYIQTDAIYARSEDALAEKILTYAKDANFCILRFWDGNIYQTDYVYSLCDKYGLMTIQNFCFACAAYPDHLESFRIEVEREAVYQVKRIATHPSLALWYGNGENYSILTSYLGESFLGTYDIEKFPGGTYIYNYMLPRICRTYSKTIDYQASTPFGGYDNHHDPKRGNRHYYPFLNLAPEKQQYRISRESIDDLECKFITESGIMGPPSEESLIRYLGCRNDANARSKNFLHHLNTFEKNAVRDGIYKHYTCKRNLTLSEYCLYGGLFQGSMLEYEADHVRSLHGCGGSIFWCLTDGFGEVGFSIMDRFGNPKPAYYFLKRAYAPCRLILKRSFDTVRVYASNNTSEDKVFTLTYGYTDFLGNATTESKRTSIPSHTDRLCVAEYPYSEAAIFDGLYFAKSDLDEYLPAILHAADFSELKLPGKANIKITDVVSGDGYTEFTVESDSYAHAVHFNTSPEVKFSDLYFDLLPGESRRIRMYSDFTPIPDSVFISPSFDAEFSEEDWLIP